MKLKFLVFTLPVLLVACASSKPPRDGGHKHERKAMGPISALSSAGLLIASFNRDDNYSIDQTEFVNGSAKAFEIADNNKDGRLSPFEMEAWRKNALGSVDASPGDMYFDADFSQQVSKQEFDVAMNKLFRTSDKDGDGNISFDELVRIITRPSTRHGQSSRQGGGYPQGGRGGGKGGRGGGR